MYDPVVGSGKSCQGLRGQETKMDRKVWATKTAFQAKGILIGSCLTYGIAFCTWNLMPRESFSVLLKLEFLKAEKYCFMMS